MELEERIDILSQAAELAQKNGALSLEEAVIAKQAIDICHKGGDIDVALKALSRIADEGQKKGVYTLRDAHFIYLASVDSENEG